MRLPHWLLAHRGWVWASVLVAALALGAVGLPRQSAVPAQVPFSEFLLDAEAGRLRAVTLDASGAIEFARTGGAVVRTTAPPNYLTLNPDALTRLARQGVTVSVRAAGTGPSPLESLWIVVSLAVIVGLGVAFHRATSGRVPAFQAGDAERAAHVVTFQDVAGADEAKDEVREVVEFLRDPGRFAAVGGRIPKGVLFVGPPGTGKTLLARSIAGEAGVPFLFASGSDFVEMYAGVGAARIRRLFKDARRHRASIVFIDEIDAVGRARGGQSHAHEEREQTLNQLLVEMDGFAPNQGLVVLAATNRPDILDRALLRPGRFDRQVTVGAPDLAGREQILGVHSRKVRLAEGVDLRRVARGTPGFCGADLANLVNEAALLAAREGRTHVAAEDLDRARDKVLMGTERRSLVMSEHDRRTCAYHEAGHAVVAAVVPESDPLHKVTIVPRGRALGLTMQLPEADAHMHTRRYLESQLTILMGGRAAEDVFLSQTTTGASNDIERATDIARRMVCDFGMSPLGPLAYGRGDDTAARGPASEATARRVDEEIHALVSGAYEAARALVDCRRQAVTALAEELLAVESVDAEGIRRIVAAYPA